MVMLLRTSLSLSVMCVNDRERKDQKGCVQ